ncbi:hypothetical protein OGAPHI_006862 [Ogataea philodendri]|uniref:Uncharacterized protein n=1 Tax=Ogataea philodendri TaxID=1378263 RepID=A0A9P8T062_9ASCO|nr:uncharacterized protein OGAPHI_006862 [Ogataea philodendri]KAH3660276.1 hypothetical protein OGAPHI_006862 [Ogataea philodendri]
MSKFLSLNSLITSSTWFKSRFLAAAISVIFIYLDFENGGNGIFTDDLNRLCVLLSISNTSELSKSSNAGLDS